MPERKYCNQPDRHVPAMKCGYPLPCPWHTVIVDQKTDSILYPSEQSEETKKKVRDIKDALKDI